MKKKIFISVAIVFIVIALSVSSVIFHNEHERKKIEYGMPSAESFEFDRYKNDMGELAEYLLQKFSDFKEEYSDLYCLEAWWLKNGIVYLMYDSKHVPFIDKANPIREDIDVDGRVYDCFDSTSKALDDWPIIRVLVFRNEVHFGQIHETSYEIRQLIYSKNPFFVEHVWFNHYTDCGYVTEKLSWHWYQRVWKD